MPRLFAWEGSSLLPPGKSTRLGLTAHYLSPKQRHCAEQQLETSQLSSRVEELSQSGVQLAQQLAETRSQLQRERSRGRAEEREGEGERGGEAESELDAARCELERAREKEKQVI